MKTAQKSAKGGMLKEIKNSFESFADDFKGGLDPFSNTMAPKNDFLGNMDNPFAQEGFPRSFGGEKKEPKRIKKSEVVFNYLERQEKSRLNTELRQLMQEVRQEVQLLKKQDAGLIEDISKLTVKDLPENATGIYHLRFLEFIVQLLRSIRKKVSEGRLWLQATSNKRGQKRFRALAKKKGTSFSQSRELTQANIPG